tara:strand:+ start:1310 stop:1879 length:570 start_codon:yes stop_codon:yes gene_type:complete
MSQKRKVKWNNYYKTTTTDRSVAAALKENLSLLPKHGLALDLACGTGGNSFFLASLGMKVRAWDYSKEAIASIKASLTNEEQIYPDEITISRSCFEDQKFDLILCCHFLDRAIDRAIFNAAAPGGLIIYQTFTSEGRVDNGPSNPDFLLNYRELFFLVRGCQVLSYREQLVKRSEKDTMHGKAYIIAKK